MIANRFRPVIRFMSTLAVDQRQALQSLPQRIDEPLPKNTSKFKHAHREALGIQFYGASSASEIVPVSPGEKTLARELLRFHFQHVARFLTPFNEVQDVIIAPRPCVSLVAFALLPSCQWCRAESEVGVLMRPWLLPRLTGSSALGDATLSSLEDDPTAMDFLSLLGDAARADMLETATSALAHAVLRVAGFQTPLSAVR